MLRSLDLNTAAERSSVQGFTLQTVARLSPNDASLPQVIQTCEMVKRGIGVVSSYHRKTLCPFYVLKRFVPSFDAVVVDVVVMSSLSSSSSSSSLFALFSFLTKNCCISPLC